MCVSTARKGDRMGYPIINSNALQRPGKQFMSSRFSPVFLLYPLKTERSPKVKGHRAFWLTPEAFLFLICLLGRCYAAVAS
jgi:hypothetical protein